MSKLPNAPLIEVIFELHWSSVDPNIINNDLNKFEMSLGAMYATLQKEFPHIVHLRPDSQIPLALFIDKPTHRFTAGDGLQNNPENYPLYQLGPGLLTVNTIDAKYDWKLFSELILRVNDTLARIFEFSPDKDLTIVLKYLDFYKLDFSKDIRSTYKDLFKFNLDLGPAVPNGTSPSLLNIESAYKSTNGIVNFSLKRGTITVKEKTTEGIVFESGIQTKIKADNYIGNLTKWLDESHEIISTFFKEITKGPTYESFK